MTTSDASASSQLHLTTQQSSSRPQDAPATINNARFPSRPPSTLTTQASRQDIASGDFTSERATLSLIRRVLAPTASHVADARSTPRPVQDILPPLTSSNEIDLQLYAIISIVIKDFVNAWYTKITPDHDFVDEVLQIIAHCSRAIEERVRHIDVTELALDGVPAIFERHIIAYRTATSAQNAISYGISPEQIYHTLNPHLALDPELTEAERTQKELLYFQMLSQGALAVLLPTEDLDNSCLRTLVGDIIADLILGRSLGTKVCESWFLLQSVSKIVVAITGQGRANAVRGATTPDKKTRLEQFGLLSSESGDQEYHLRRQRQSSLSAWGWRVLQCGYLIYLFLHFVIVGLLQARHLPLRTRHTKDFRSNIAVSNTVGKPTLDAVDLSPQSVLSYKVFSTVSTLLDLSARMPWLKGTIAFYQHILVSGVAGPNSVFDRFIYHTLDTTVFTSAVLPKVLLNLRVALFPDNAMGPPAPPPPSKEEALQIRRAAAEDILSLVPLFTAKTLFAARDRDQIVNQIETDILDVMSNTYMNKHLIYGILDFIMVALIPELAKKTPSELLGERGVMG